MQGHKQFTDKVVVHFRLSERVPRHNLYRRLDEVLDLRFLYPETQVLYSHTGQPALDPVVFFKLLLVGRLENIASDRRLLAHCALRLDILLFLGYELDEELPWHSTISRTRQLYPTALFEHLFDRVFHLCVAQGLVAGDTQAIDSAPVKANASLDSLCEKQAAAPLVLTVAGQPAPASTLPTAALLSAPAHQLRREAARKAKHGSEPGALGGKRPHARLVSNKTHYSPSDPEARISIKPGKARALNYLCSLAVDPAKGVISHIQADLADSHDSLHLPGLIERLQARLTANEVPLREVVADTSYANGFNYAFLEQRGLTAWIPASKLYKPTIEGFTYLPDVNAYYCPAGKLLPFRNYGSTPDGSWQKNYRADYKDCSRCPLKARCVPKTAQRKITRTAFDAPYLRAWQRQHSRQGQHMRRVRQGTVEPALGQLLPHYGLRRVGTKGQAGAHKTMLLAAAAYNLRKLLKHRVTQPRSMALVLQPDLLSAFSSPFWLA
ncbi:IS1182 family transposase [uncultured Hymenobacter sp.]|uniref:IS1182 family transposase n=1 Tax=uncultured Hymenobacter sp. TaxID=170016 RepID=UPI0035CCA927